MIIQRKRIRREYQPLTTAVSLQVLTPNSPLNQVFDPEEMTYTPDREITPLAIVPIVSVGASDGSWTKSRVNVLLSNMKWFVNGVDITSLPAWLSKYTIETEGDNRGAITIKKNIGSEEDLELHFEAVIPDERLGVNIPVQSERTTLTTTDKADDNWAVSIDSEPDILYNPFLDKLLIYGYKLANGLNAGSRADALDSNAYEKTINLNVAVGGKTVADGYVAVWKRLNGQVASDMTVDDDEVIAMTNKSIMIDQRLIEKSDYMVMILVEGEEVARQQFSIARTYPSYGIEIASNVTINAGEEYHHNRAFVSHNSKIVEIPEVLIKMVWFTDTEKKKNKQWQEGGRVLVRLDEAEVGVTYLDDWMDLYIGSEHKKAYYQFTAGTDVYTDENGNNYIGN